MKLLLIADEESPRLYEHYRPGCLNGIDLILSAGDLKAHYAKQRKKCSLDIDVMSGE